MTTQPEYPSVSSTVHSAKAGSSVVKTTPVASASLIFQSTLTANWSCVRTTKLFGPPSSPGVCICGSVPLAVAVGEVGSVARKPVVPSNKTITCTSFCDCAYAFIGIKASAKTH